MKRAITLLWLLFLINISGCATIQLTLKELQEKIAVFWEGIKGEKTEEQVGTREEAAKKYGYKGLKEELIVENPIITPEVIKPGDTVKQEIQYALLAPQKEKKFNVSETVILTSGKDTVELIKRSSERTQGMHLSTIKFTIPADLEPGEYTLITMLSSGEQKRTVSGKFRVEKF